MKRNENELSSRSTKASRYAAIAAALLAVALAGCATPSAGDGESLASVEMPIDHGTGGDA